MDYNIKEIAENATTIATYTKIVSDYEFEVFQSVVYVGLIGIVTCFGVVANVINIVVFVRMGVMKDSSNVSLLGLAIADFGGVTFLLVMGVLNLISLLHIPNLTWDPMSLVYVAGGWPHVVFAQMTCLITGYIAFERCMCVVFPFKVKTWFSPQRSLVVISCIVLYFAISYMPVFITRQLQWRLDLYDNITRLSIVFGPNHQIVENISQYTNIFFSTTANMIIVMVCTKITVSRVQSSSNWRLKTSTSGGTTNKSLPLKTCNQPLQATQQDPGVDMSDTNTVNLKERTMVKMITAISSIFILCNIPGVAIPYVRLVFPEINHLSRYHNLFYVIYGSSFLLESINSSANIFVYYRLGSRYRQEFRKMFHLK